MPPPERPRSPSGIPGYQWLTTDDGSRTLWNEQLGEAFHSGCGAVEESLVVYLINSGVADRLQRSEPTTVLEIGFGTGTAFLLTASLAEYCRTPLDYTALEVNLLPVELFEGLVLTTGNHLPEPAFAAAETLRTAWIAAMGQLDVSSRQHRWQLSEFVSLNLILEDAQRYRCPPDERKHAVYFDPFSPESSAELWSAGMFEQMYEALLPGGTLTSYCVKGSIRRMLAAAGFDVAKLPGPPRGKREVLRARRPETVGAEMPSLDNA